MTDGRAPVARHPTINTDYVNQGQNSVPPNQFEIYSHNLPKPGKERNGDAYQIQELHEEDPILLTIADGVGSHICDWHASATTCQVVCDSFEHTEGRTPDRLRLAVQRAHNQVSREIGDCAGAQSTLVAVVWEVSENKIHYVSIGDSRLYRQTSKGIMQLTNDDTASIMATVAGEPVLSAGMPVFIKGLPKAIGQQELLDVNVHMCEFEEGESLVLATDGMHGYGLFLRDLEVALSIEDLRNALPGMLQRHSAVNNDDASIVILRRNDIREESRELYRFSLERQMDYREQGLFGHLMATFLKRELVQAWEASDSKQIRLCFEYAQSFNLLPGRTFLMDLLGQMIKGGTVDRSLIQRVRKAIQILPT